MCVCVCVCVFVCVCVCAVGVRRETESGKQVLGLDQTGVASFQNWQIIAKINTKQNKNQKQTSNIEKNQ
jgi:hypothetical protein